LIEHDVNCIVHLNLHLKSLFTFHKRETTQTTNEAAVPEDKEYTANNGGNAEDCTEDHGLGITFGPECDYKYCAPRYFLHDVLCKGCGVKFVDQFSSNKESEYKPSTKNAVYVCAGNTRGCKVAYCKMCYVKLPTTNAQKEGGRCRVNK